MNLRSEVGQVAWVGRRYASTRRLRLQRDVIRAMDLPVLPRRRRVAGEVWAVGIVRDEADVVGLVLDHTLSQGIDHVLIADNGSRDGTRELLGDLAARDPRVHVADDRLMAHHQSEKVTWLAHQAWRSGADWILPIDGDEFWFAEGQSVAERLRASTKGIVHAHFHHMVPTSGSAAEPEGWTFLLDSTPGNPGKVAARAHPLLEVHAGNHAASRVGGEEVGLFIAHAVYRGPAQVARKVRQGQRATVAAGRSAVPAQHWQLASQLDDDAIAHVWSRMVGGEPEPGIAWAAAGPMVQVRPVAWSTWDPQAQIPRPT